MATFLQSGNTPFILRGLFMKLNDSFKKMLGFPVDTQYREQFQEEIVLEVIRPYETMAAIILVMQLVMASIFLFKPGGTFVGFRSTRYFFLYVLLALLTVGFLLACRKYRRKPVVFLRIGAIYSAAICYWACGITYLDQMGGNDLAVFCYMLPTVAAFSFLKPVVALPIFGSSCLILNLLLLTQPEGMNNLFNNLVNSVFITLLSAFICVSMYRRKVVLQYDQIVIRKQNEKIFEMNRVLNQMVITDDLTKMYNRRYLENVVPKRLQEEDFSSLAGLMIDIDYFKQYNDRYGHLAGDECLRNIASVLMGFADMEKHFVIRYGGEEFFFCMLGGEREAALDLAENLRAAVEQARFLRDDIENDCVTVSIGVSVLQNQDAEAGLEMLVQRADDALYRAKKEGKNRVAFTEWN